jgi:CheY-like chemotaxis protein
MQKKLGFEIMIDEGMPRSLLIDELRLRQILFNLIGNAVKFTERGGIAIRVVHIPKGGDSSSIDLIIEIEDTGIGIPEYELDSIFAPFIQKSGQDVMRFGGSGLGLSITKNLVEMMGGTISVESELGVGSKFIVCIKELEISSMAHNGKESDLELANIVFEESRILLVEDIESNRKVVTGFLEKFNFTIVQAENGKIALDVLEKNSFDLILMDMQMPELDGRSACRIIKKKEQYKHIPILVLTATTMKENADEILTFADGYLCKPISKIELINEIAKFLPHRKNVPDLKNIEIGDTDFLHAIKEFINLNSIKQEFKVELKNLFIESESARKSLQTNKLTLFATKLESLSEQYRIEPLKKFAANLLQLIKKFSISEISHQLDSFRAIYSIITTAAQEI